LAFRPFIAEKRRNVEIKARVADLPSFIARVRSIADSGPTLIHFVEIEVALNGKETVESGIETAHSMMKQLGIFNDALIDKAYVDLLNGR
jgi:hypothetical protein